MNRLILVGNGFDLAHGLKTSYKHFIDDFWNEQIADIKQKTDEFSLSFKNNHIRIIQNIYNRKPIYNPEILDYYEYLQYLNINSFKIEINNLLLKISLLSKEMNWVDIENVYYNELKKTKDINKLNKDFEEIKNLLNDYLLKLDKKTFINKNINSHLYSRFYLRDFSYEISKIWVEEIFKNPQEQIKNGDNKEENKIHLKKIIDDYNNKIKVLHGVDERGLKRRFDYFSDILDKLGIDGIFYSSLKPNVAKILNFNYTSSIANYINYENIINIHGELKNKMNPIIFGFGDDVDKKYQEFEDLNDNRYLENFKSIAYLQTDNYKKLLEFIDSEEYQVFIFGHSCGISDRTMLNTIFEHDNCKSIKPFYHKREDGTDNYTEIVQNISRNFNDKKKYRDRVVNKTYCEPLT